jgi:hypothetical protein
VKALEVAVPLLAGELGALLPDPPHALLLLLVERVDVRHRRHELGLHLLVGVCVMYGVSPTSLRLAWGREKKKREKKEKNKAYRRAPG